MDKENDASTGIVFIDGSPLTFVTFNSNPGGLATVDINHAGIARIVDRTITFEAKPKYFSFEAISGVSAPTGTGNFIIYINGSGVVTITDINGQSRLSAYDPDNLDMNEVVQVGQMSVEDGSIGNSTIFPQWVGNIGNRQAGIMDALGVINSIVDKVTISIPGGGLGLDIEPGLALSRGVGFQEGAFDQGADYVKVSSTPGSLVVLVTRDNVIVGFSFSIDTLNYESPVGTLTVIPPNKSANRFTTVFPSSQFIGYLLGQEVYTTTTLALESFELADFPSIFAGGAPVLQIAVDKNETDLANAVFKELPRLFL
jgi:hypothetical protein